VGDALYIVGTLMQMAAYIYCDIRFSVVCAAGIAYWCALYIGFVTGSLK